jgi:hypothetical protein
MSQNLVKKHIRLRECSQPKGAIQNVLKPTGEMPSKFFSLPSEIPIPNSNHSSKRDRLSDPNRMGQNTAAALMTATKMKEKVIHVQ